MKTVLNSIRRMNISNSIIERSTGFDQVQLKAFAINPSEYPIMNNVLEKFHELRLADKYKRAQLNFVPISHEKTHTRHDMIPVKENVWSKGKASLKRMYQRIMGN